MFCQGLFPSAFVLEMSLELQAQGGMTSVKQLGHNTNEDAVPGGLSNIKMERAIGWEIGPLVIQVRIHGFEDVIHFSHLGSPDMARGHSCGFTLDGDARAHNF
jgi:hypothetical protein